MSDPINAAESARLSRHDRYFSSSEVDKNLGKSAVRGGAITIATQGFRFVMRTGSTAILARMLAPEDFGLISMVTVVVGFTEILNNAGLAAATIQRKEITHAQVSTLFWANVAISSILTLIVAAMSPLISWFYQEPKLLNVTLVLSTSIFFGGLPIQHQALLRRTMEFGRLAIIHSVALFACVGIAIIMAWWGMGYWSLVAMTVAFSVVAAILSFLISGWMPNLPSRGSGAREMLHFGLGVSSFTIVNYISRNFDNFLIGWRWGAGPLGVYSKAYGLLLLPSAQISSPAMAAFMPMLCRLNDQPEKFRAVFKQIIQALSLLTMPGVASMIVAADAAVYVFLGDQWNAAVPVFQILGFAAIFECVFGTLAQPLIACGKASTLYRLGLIAAIPTIASFIIGLPFGPKGVAAGYTISNTLIVCPLVFIFVAAQTPVKVLDFYRAMFPPLVLAGLTAALLFGIRWFFNLQSPLLILFVAGLCVAPSMIWGVQKFRQIRNVQHG
ncbi:lipopolysaccharide biosynthesis protein [Blastopirellula marina]|uniref:lipopolysaccharide biosynthesis protein n=1 Tax=Blastopirellula marina TaxID=124 RepID=UPI00130487FD|nr:lipopolysaccharide biosynthesis protein [Blastopirellula marina]